MTARRRMLVIALWLAAVLAFLFTIARLIGIERGFVPVVVVSYTPYVAVVAFLLLLAALGFRQWGPAIPAAIAAGVLIVLVSPRALEDQQRADADGPGVTVMTANMLFGEADPETLVDLVRSGSVEVLAVEELTDDLSRELDEVGLRGLLPNRVVMPAPRAGGAGLYSTHPLAAAEPVPAQVGGLRTPRGVIAVPGAAPLEVAVAHPVPPSSPDKMRAWQVGLRSLPHATPDGQLRIVIGDFNATLDHAEVRRLVDTGYRDAADVTGAGLVPTWPSGIIPPPVTIDRVLVDERIGVTDLTVHDLPGSDHRAVQAELRLP